MSAASGRPYSLRTGEDDYHTGQTNARPSGVSRNTLEGPGYVDVDLRWSREFKLADGSKGEDAPAIRFGVDAFNVLNHVNYAAYIGTLTSLFFGHAIAALPPRRLQLTASVTF